MRYYGFLIKRIHDVEMVIENHFKQIHNTLIKQKNDNFEHEKKMIKLNDE